MKRLLRKYAWYISAALILVGYVMFFRTAQVNGTSMQPTYDPADLLLVWRTESVNRGDIIVIYNEQLRELLCKRVIGVAGDHVVIDSYGLMINDEPVTEDYVIRQDWYSSSAKVDIVVPDGELFAMGDNRPVSNDSRALGCMAISDLTGVVIWNVTKTIGVRRDTLISIVTLLIVGSIGYEVVSKLRGSSDNNTETSE